MVTADHPVTLICGLYSRGSGLYSDFLWVIQIFFCNLADSHGHGGRKKGDLAFFWSLVQYPLHVIQKSHAQHFVGFIQYKCGNSFQIKRTTAHVIHDTSRCTYHNMHSALERAQLNVITLTSINRQNMKIFQPSRISLECFCYLNG